MTEPEPIKLENILNQMLRLICLGFLNISNLMRIRITHIEIYAADPNTALFVDKEVKCFMKESEYYEEVLKFLKSTTAPTEAERKEIDKITSFTENGMHIRHYIDVMQGKAKPQSQLIIPNKKIITRN